MNMRGKSSNGSLNLPRYPISIITLGGNDLSYHLKCSCSYEWTAYVELTGASEYTVFEGGYYKWCCPACLGMEGMSAEQHAEALTEIQLRLAVTSKQMAAKTKGFTWWLQSQHTRLTHLIRHTSEIIIAKARGEVVNPLSEYNRLTFDKSLPIKPRTPESDWIAMGDMGPFPLRDYNFNLG